MLVRLIKAGAFDCFATPDQPAKNGYTGSRSDLLFNLDTIIAFSQKSQKEAASGQGSLLDMLGGEVAGSVSHLELAAAPTQATGKEQLGWERELLGLYLSAHPLDNYDTYLREQTNATKSIKSEHDGALVTIGGLINKNRTLVTKAGTKMAFMTIEDKTGEIEVVIFPKTFEKMPQNIDPSDIVLIKGRVSGKDKEGNTMPDPSVVADSVQIIDDEVLKAYQPTGVPMGEVDMSTVGKRRSSSSNGKWKGGGGAAGGYAAKSTVKAGPPIDMSQYNVVDSSKPKILYIHIKDPTDGKKLVAMKEKVGEYKGGDQVILVLGEAAKKSAIRMPVRTKICEELESAVSSIFGADCVAVR